MQRELDDYIIDNKKIMMSGRQWLNALFCATYSELLEVEESVMELDMQHTLEEYIDVLHFVLAIGYRIKIDESPAADLTLSQIIINKNNSHVGSVMVELTKLMDNVKAYKFWKNSDGHDRDLYIQWVKLIHTIYGNAVIHTRCDITLFLDMYRKKWQINKDRQDEGY